MRLVFALALVSLLGGCAAPAGQDAAPLRVADAGARVLDASQDAGAAPDLNASTAAPPTLVPGEWWRIHFHGGIFSELNMPDLVRVVAAVGPDGYLVGMPHEAWTKEAIVFHAPAFGDVGRDLSYDVHNKRFTPLRFPLRAGDSWTTDSPLGNNTTATVESADESTATIRYDPPPGSHGPTDALQAALMSLSPIDPSGPMRAVYDARHHEIVHFEAPFGEWDVVAHGTGFAGWVTVPRGEHTAIDEGSFGASGTRQLDVRGGFNRMTILQAVIAFAPGAYRVRDVAPDGTEFVTESVAGRALTVGFFEASSPDGAWRHEAILAGAGATYTMGMAYHQYDIRVPDGAVRGDHAHGVTR